MLNYLNELLFSVAFAQDAAEVQQPSLISSLAPLVLIVVVFYFLLIRPQQTRLKEHQNMLKSLKKGDKVVTAGGLIATIVKVESDAVVVAEISQDVRVKVRKDTITEIVSDKSVK